MHLVRLRRAVLAFTLALAPALALGPNGAENAAEASVSRLISLDELVASAAHVVVATPVDSMATWEEIGASKRIVTYTRLRVERSVRGGLATQATVWVRTLGGAVGGVGQSVSGEADLAIGVRAMLFLHDAKGTLVVAGRAQGHFPVGTDNKLRSSRDVGALLPAPGPIVSAREVLVGAALESAVARVQAVKAGTPRGQ